MADTNKWIQDGEPVDAEGVSTDIANRHAKAAHDSFGRHRWVGNANVASASTIAIPDDANRFVVTGTTTIAAISNKDATYFGPWIMVKFTSALTLTHNASSFIMPRNQNYSVSAGEVITFHEITAGNYEFVSTNSGLAVTEIPGALSRPKFTYATTTAILIDAGWYHVDGAAEHIASWSSQLTFTFGPGGSNAGSSSLGVSQDQHLYIDDSSVTVGTVLTAANFIASTTAPTFSQAKGGWYNGSDRCVWSFRTTGSSLLEIFWHDGGATHQYDVRKVDANLITPSTTYTDVTLTIPAFATKALIATAVASISAASGGASWRRNGSATGFQFADVNGSSTVTEYNTFIVFTDSSQIIEVAWSGASSNTISIGTDAWEAPEKM